MDYNTWPSLAIGTDERGFMLNQWFTDTFEIMYYYMRERYKRLHKFLKNYLIPFMSRTIYNPHLEANINSGIEYVLTDKVNKSK